jgi:hypothetical protein
MKKLLALCLISLLLLCSCKTTAPSGSDEVFDVTGGLFYKGELYFKDNITEKAKKKLPSIDVVGGLWIVNGSLYFDTFETENETQENYDISLYRADLKLNNITKIYSTKCQLPAGYYAPREFFSPQSIAISEFIFDKHSNTFLCLSLQDEDNLALKSVDVNGQNEKTFTTIDRSNLNNFAILFPVADETYVTIVSEKRGECRSYKYNKTTGETIVSDSFPATEPENTVFNDEEFLFAGLTLLADNLTTSVRRTVTDFEEIEIFEKEQTGYVCGISDGRLLVNIAMKDYSEQGGSKNVLYYLYYVNPATGEKEIIYKSEE